MSDGNNNNNNTINNNSLDASERRRRRDEAVIFSPSQQQQQQQQQQQNPPWVSAAGLAAQERQDAWRRQQQQRQLRPSPLRVAAGRAIDGIDINNNTVTDDPVYNVMREAAAMEANRQQYIQQQEQQQQQQQQQQQRILNNNNTNNTAAAAASTQEILWRERERRQRTVRAFMMFLFLLLLLDDDPNNRPPPNNNGGAELSPQRLRHRSYPPSVQLQQKQQQAALLQQRHGGGLEPQVWHSRQAQDAALAQILTMDERYQMLVEKNDGVAVDVQVHEWAQTQVQEILERQKQLQLQKQQNNNNNSNRAADNTATAAAATTTTTTTTAASDSNNDEENPEEVLPHTVWHYPWNITGLFLGDWVRQENAESTSNHSGDDTEQPHADKGSTPKPKSNQQEESNNDSLDLTEPLMLEDDMLQVLHKRKQKAGVYFLTKAVRVRDDHNFTSLQLDHMVVDSSGRMYTPAEDLAVQNPFWKMQQKQQEAERKQSTLPLHQTAGRVAIRLFARSVPGMAEMSVVDGSVKLYDRNSHHYASPVDDVVVRVRGVLFHKVGKLSLVSSSSPITHSALILERPEPRKSKTTTTTRQEVAAASRRLTEVNWDNLRVQPEPIQQSTLDKIRDDVWTVNDKPLREWVDANDRRLEEEADGVAASDSTYEEDDDNEGDGGSWDDIEEATTNSSLRTGLPLWSNVVIPFPYVRDDSDESFRQIRTPGSRRLMPQERLLEENAAHCRFEMDFNIQPEEWTIEEWRKLIRRKVMEKERLRPSPELEGVAPTGTEAAPTTSAEPAVQHASRQWSGRPRRRPPPQDEALVMVINGTIRSDNCHFEAKVNATALRTDWELTTSRAMNYSFYMMLVCLAQIVVLLRQLLHSQAQSAATRVSMVCVGWQTVIDGLLCLGHIFLSLAMANLFTPFASVAFFKLLIFCVIEMKYMAIIISARNSANGGQPTEVLRRQVAVLHLRYYVTLFGALLLLLYVDGNTLLRLYFLGLYSFWVPQIVLNVITQAKTPLHKHYIYGMSASRLVAPLYIFCVKNNFLRGVYPDVPYDPLLGQLLVLWVGIQAAVLIAQGKYGTRFMIPQCFLPPKFDYHRPIPTSMLPPGALDMHTDPMEDDTRVVTSAEMKRDAEVMNNGSADRHTTSVTTRLRRAASTSPAVSGSGGGGAATTTTTIATTTGATTKTVTEKPTPRPSRPTLDCCICYDAIEIQDRQGYMLAPCDHLFHRNCLIQWMDVKMACPICRSDLPAL